MRGQGGGQGGGDGGGGHQTAVSCGSNKACAGSRPPKNLTIGLIWLVTRGGRRGGGWAREAGKGGGDRGGGTESSVGATRRALVPP